MHISHLELTLSTPLKQKKIKAYSINSPLCSSIKATRSFKRGYKLPFQTLHRNGRTLNFINENIVPFRKTLIEEISTVRKQIRLQHESISLNNNWYKTVRMDKKNVNKSTLLIPKEVNGNSIKLFLPRIINKKDNTPSNNRYKQLKTHITISIPGLLIND